MPRKNPLPEHEVAICQRLQAFRHSTGIPRKLFAGKVGIRDSVLVRIEHLRTPVRYWVYKAIDKNFPLNPFWLRTGQGVPQIGSSVNDSTFANEVGRLDRFSDVYDRFLSSRINSEVAEAEYKIWESIRAMRCIAELAKAGKLAEHPLELLQEFLSAQNEMLNEIAYLFEYEDKVKARLRKRSLTSVHASVKQAEVKAQWPLLKHRLQKATSATGKKSVLAKFLKVKLASVSQWLTDSDNAREPGAETTLLMQYWVDHPELQ